MKTHIALLIAATVGALAVSCNRDEFNTFSTAAEKYPAPPTSLHLSMLF